MRIRFNARGRTPSSVFGSAAVGRSLAATALVSAVLLGAAGAPAQEASGRIYVRRIELEGVTATADSVLRDELVQLESSFLNTGALEESLRRIARLPFVAEVRASLRPVEGHPDQVDIVVSIAEAPARRYGGGGGWSEAQRGTLRVHYTDDNLLGTGRRLSLAAEGSALRSAVELSYVKPHVGQGEAARSIEISSRRVERLTKNASVLDAGLTSLVIEYGYPLDGGGPDVAALAPGRRLLEEALLPSAEVRERLAALGEVLDERRHAACCGSLRLGVALRRAELTAKPGLGSQLLDWISAHGAANLAAPNAQLDEIGMLLRYRRDTRDRPVFPRRGIEHRVDFTVTLPGSDVEYLLGEYRLAAYRPLAGRWTLRASGRLGYGAAYGETASLPPYLHWFAGGPLTVRGYRENSLGPRDSLGNPYGGNLLVAARLELMTPWPRRWRERARVGLFADAGNVFATERVTFADAAGGPLDYGFDGSALRTSVGVAAEALMPFGMLRLSYAAPLGAQDRHPNPFLRDAMDRFQLSLGIEF
jgi:outer membrane protein insertion porin family